MSAPSGGGGGYSSPTSTPSPDSNDHAGDPDGLHFADGAMALPFATNIGPSAIYNVTSNRTFVVYQGEDFDPYAVQYDHTNKTYSSPTRIGDNPLVDDLHGIPAFIQDANGTLHAFYGVHGEHGALMHATSDAPNDATAWTEHGSIVDDVTYPVAFNVDGDLYIILRLYDDGLKNRTGYIRSVDGGETWSDPMPLFGQPPDSRSYHMGAVQDDTDIHLTLHRRLKSPIVHLNVYHVVFDTVNGTVQTVNGTNLGDFASPNEVADEAKVFDSNGTEVSMAETRLDTDGNPHIVFTYEHDGTFEWRHLYYNGTAWVGPAYIASKGATLRAGAALAIEPDGNLTAWLPTNVTDRAGDIERWQYNGNWTYEATIYDAGNWSIGAGDVRLVKNGTEEFRVVFGQTDSDDFTNNDLWMFAYGADGYVRPS